VDVTAGEIRNTIVSNYEVEYTFAGKRVCLIVRRKAFAMTETYREIINNTNRILDERKNCFYME
jgi:hypothetical protein